MRGCPFQRRATGRPSEIQFCVDRDLGKQTFHQVQPTATGGSEVDVIARVARPPRSYLRHLVGSVVIHHQVDVKAAGQIRFDVLEKSQELLMPVAPVATADRYAAGPIQAANKEVTPCRS